jgi:hypothetical protein
MVGCVVRDVIFFSILSVPPLRYDVLSSGVRAIFMTGMMIRGPDEEHHTCRSHLNRISSIYERATLGIEIGFTPKHSMILRQITRMPHHL